jgi:hypothetical protein
MVNPVIMGLFSIEMKVFDGFNQAYQTHRDLQGRIKEYEKRFSNKKEDNYDPHKYLNKVDIGPKSRSTDNLKQLDHPKGLSKFHNCKIDNRFLPYQTKGIDETNFEKIKNVFSN